MLVGDFSPEDCDDYLARRLTRDGRPLIGEPLRQVITARSHGVPLYLDLSVARVLELRCNGRTPHPGAFDHDSPALVRNAADTADDRWTETDWRQAAERASPPRGEQHQAADGPSRLLLVACLRQGLRLGRDQRLQLDWLTGAAWPYVSDSVWDVHTSARVQAAAFL
ncbi:hypothetical protein ABZ725_48875 [Streptomyces sp. NPDC006872]|uniref:hypothetical protein n=1 Tax=Streptomyces sp. NPDC006872 TaxID=3155720 RepID=UPI003411CCAE